MVYKRAGRYVQNLKESVVSHQWKESIGAISCFQCCFFLVVAVVSCDHFTARNTSNTMIHDDHTTKILACSRTNRAV